MSKAMKHGTRKLKTQVEIKNQQLGMLLAAKQRNAYLTLCFNDVQ